MRCAVSILVCLIGTTINYTECARILGVFPMPGQSHYILYSKLMKGLVAAGHDVTMVSPYVMTDVPKNGKYNDVLLTGFADDFQSALKKNNLFEMNNQNPISMIISITEMFLSFTNNTLHHPNVRDLIKSNKTFDAVIMEQFSNDAVKVFADIYQCPLIILSSIGPNSWVNPMVGNPQPASYAGHLVLGDISKDLSFSNRAKNLALYIIDYVLRTYYTLPRHEEVMLNAFPNSSPLYDLFTNVSLILLNSHTSLYSALPVVPNMVEIGGYFIDPPKKLPEDLQQFLDNAKEGVIYFSMGSTLKSKDMPEKRKKLLLNVLRRLQEKVLWKFEEELPGKPENVMISKWLPQQDILAHPNIKLFITHGGLLSTTETVYHGVPVLAIPVFGDQSANADRIEQSGYGLKLHYNSPDFTEEVFESKIRELLRNPKYKENVQSRSKIYHDRPIGPMETAVYWVEYIIRHKGAQHLRVAGVRLPWYKYYMVDVLGAFLLFVVGVMYVLKMVLIRLFCSREMRKQKTN